MGVKVPCLANNEYGYAEVREQRWRSITNAAPAIIPISYIGTAEKPVMEAILVQILQGHGVLREGVYEEGLELSLDEVEGEYCAENKCLVRIQWTLRVGPCSAEDEVQ